MSESFDLLDPTNFVAGTVGEPGDRIFFIQGADTTDLVSLKLEKGQVQGLASGMAELLDRLDVDKTASPPSTLIEPVMAAWTVGGLGIGLDEEGQRVVVVADEIIENDEQEAATARFHLTYSQARGFIEHSLFLVEYGRDFGRQNGHRPH
ncbi:MAG: DUF3090 family protein [Actinomycetota bacterium]|nr:DUF3090 family protein [Actinomycetota bacterium]